MLAENLKALKNKINLYYQNANEKEKLIVEQKKLRHMTYPIRGKSEYELKVIKEVTVYSHFKIFLIYFFVSIGLCIAASVCLFILAPRIDMNIPAYIPRVLIYILTFRAFFRHKRLNYAFPLRAIIHYVFYLLALVMILAIIKSSGVNIEPTYEGYFTTSWVDTLTSLLVIDVPLLIIFHIIRIFHTKRLIRKVDENGALESVYKENLHDYNIDLESYNQRLEKSKDRIREVNNKMERLVSEIVSDQSIPQRLITENFINGGTILRMLDKYIEYLESGRATSMTEAINLLISEDKQEELNRQILEQQRQQTEYMRRQAIEATRATAYQKQQTEYAKKQAEYQRRAANAAESAASEINSIKYKLP